MEEVEGEVMQIGGPLMIFGSCHASGLLAAMPRLVQAPTGLLDKGSVLATILLLFAGHAVCDYALQGQFMSDAKNHRKPIPGIPWYHPLAAHALIHAGMVYIVTASLWFALAELVIHCATDYAKCNGNIDFQEDQFVHYSCKLLWAIW